VLATWRCQPRHILGPDFRARPTQMGQGRIHGERVPLFQHAYHQTQRFQPILLALAVALPDLAPLLWKTVRATRCRLSPRLRTETGRVLPPTAHAEAGRLLPPTSFAM
jgi:hypothetical protein